MLDALQIYFYSSPLVRIVDPFCGIHMSIVESSSVFLVTGEVTHSWTLHGWLSVLATPYLLLRKVG